MTFLPFQEVTITIKGLHFFYISLIPWSNVLTKLNPNNHNKEKKKKLGNFSKLMSNLLLSNTLYFDGSLTNQYTKSGQGPSTNHGSSSSSSNTGLLETVVMAGAAIAGIAMLRYFVSKLFQVLNGVSKLFQEYCFKATLIEPKFHVLHVDGLDSNQLEQAAAGCIIRDKDGELVVASAYNLGYCYPGCHIAVAEAMALKKGLELAIDQKIKLDLIKVDNEEVIDRVLGTHPKPPKEPTLIQVIKDIKKYLDPETQLILISSDYNKVADELANIGRGLGNHENKYCYKASPDIPLKLANFIIEEKKNFMMH